MRFAERGLIEATGRSHKRQEISMWIVDALCMQLGRPGHKEAARHTVKAKWILDWSLLM